MYKLTNHYNRVTDLLAACFIKKNLTLIPVLLVLCLCIFISCDKENKEELKPNISFVESGNYIYQDVSMQISSDFQVGINASPNAVSNAKLTILKITRTFSGQDTPWMVLTDPVTESDFPREINLTALFNVQTETFSFIIIDEDGQENNVELKITTFE